LVIAPSRTYDVQMAIKCILREPRNSEHALYLCLFRALGQRPSGTQLLCQADHVSGTQ
jgi:hypothetical protein